MIPITKYNYGIDRSGNTYSVGLDNHLMMHSINIIASYWYNSLSGMISNADANKVMALSL